MAAVQRCQGVKQDFWFIVLKRARVWRDEPAASSKVGAWERGHSTLQAVYVMHNHIDHNPGAPGRAVAERFKVKRYFDNGHLKGSGEVNAKWIRKNKDTEGRDIHLREIKDSEIPAPTDEGLTDGDSDPIGCADCERDDIDPSPGLFITCRVCRESRAAGASSLARLIPARRDRTPPYQQEVNRH